MNLSGLGAGLGLLQTAGQIGLGIGQLIQARKYRMERPDYEIPDVIGQRLGLRQQLLQARMPGAQQAERNIATAQQSGLYNMSQGATDSASILASAAGAQATTNQAMQNLAQMESQDYYNRLSGLESAQGQMAQYQDKEFEDRMKDYQEKQATRSSLIGSGIQNLFGATSAMQEQLGMREEIMRLGGDDPYEFLKKRGKLGPAVYSNRYF